MSCGSSLYLTQFNTQSASTQPLCPYKTSASPLYLHKILVPDLAELYEVRLQAVHLFVRLAVVHGLCLQVLLQAHFAVVDLSEPRLELLVVHHDPLDLLVVALAAEALDVVLAVALLCVALLLEDLDGLVEGFDGCSLHLDLLRGEEEVSEWTGEKHFSGKSSVMSVYAYLRRLGVFFVQSVVLFALLLVLIVVFLQLLPNSINIILLYQLVLRDSREMKALESEP